MDVKQEETLADPVAVGETEIMAPTKAAEELAWSAGDLSVEPALYRRWRTTWVIAAAIAVPLCVAAAVIAIPQWMHDSPAPAPSVFSGFGGPNWTPPPAAAAPTPAPVSRPVLDGAYRIVFDEAGTTYRGNGVPPKHTGTSETVWAFRSHCTDTSCAANGTKLDTNNHAVADVTDSMNFVNGQWIENALSEDATQFGLPAACGTVSTQWTMRPQPDGTLVGTATNTIMGDCGSHGNVTQVPITVMRVGPVPDGVLKPEIQ